MFVDSHCHLTHLDLDIFGGTLDGVIEAAQAAEVHKMLCISVDLDNALEVVKIADTYDCVYASVGIHPMDCKDGDPDITRFQQLLSSKKVIAVGEIGLDYHYAADSKALQQTVFIQQLVVAKENELPVVVHTRDAREDTLALLREYGCENKTGVLHCFTESWEMAEAALDMNYYISFSGIVTFKKAEELREVAKKVPLDRLLIETDAPYLAPVPYRGKPNEPARVSDVGRFVAELRGVSVEQLAQQVEQNFDQLFLLN